MEKIVLENMVNEGLSTYQIAQKLCQSQTNVRHWLKKFELKTNKKKSPSVTCVLCGRQSKGRGKYCQLCSVKIRRYRQKIAAVNYKGGKCEVCGYDKNLAVLEFHHKDPSIKDKEFMTHRTKKWESIKNEVDKCVLLCSNCHREEHEKLFGNIKSLTMDIARDYNGEDEDFGKYIK